MTKLDKLYKVKEVLIDRTYSKRDNINRLYIPDSKNYGTREICTFEEQDELRVYFFYKVMSWYFGHKNQISKVKWMLINFTQTT